MPTVPYNPVPDVSPSERGTPYFTDRGATPEAFGAGVGAAEEGFGKQIERASDTAANYVLQTQQLKNEADVNAAVTTDLTNSGELNNKFRMLPGNQAQAGLDDHVKALKESREAIRSTLPPAQQRMFDQQTMHRFALDVVNSSQYAGQQMKAYTNQTYDDKKSAIIQDAAKRLQANPNDPSIMQSAIRQLVDIENQQGKLNGQSPDGVSKNIRNTMTGATAAITSALSKNDPDKAQAIFNAARKNNVIDETKAEQIQNTIDDHAINNRAMLDGQEITSKHIQADPERNAANPNGTLFDMMQDAQKRADERYPNDPILRDRYLKQLETNIQSSANTQKKVFDDQTMEMKNTLLNMATQDLPNGRKPTSIQEMNTLNPRAQDYYDEARKRDPNFAVKLNNQFVTNNDTDKIVPPDQLNAQKLIWSGMQPSQKMQADPSNMFQQGLIDKKTRDSMLNDQYKIKSQANNVFAADAVMRSNGALLNDKGIFASRTDTEANTRYMWFRGALESELQRRQTAGGAPIKGPEANAIINDLLKQVPSQSKKTWFGFGGPAQEEAYKVMKEDQPDYVAKNYPDAVRAPNGKWVVWRDGKPNYVNPGEEK